MTAPREQHSKESSPVGRRTFLAGVGAIGSAVFAGCIGDGDDEGDEEPDNLDEEIEEDRQLNGVVLSSEFPIQLFEGQTDDRIAEVHYHAEFSHWHFTPFEIPLEGWRPVEARIFDDDQEVIPLGPDERFGLRVTRTDDTPEDLFEVEVSGGSLFNFHGVNLGDGELLFHLVEDEEDVWTTPPLAVEVTDDFDAE